MPRTSFEKNLLGFFDLVAAMLDHEKVKSPCINFYHSQGSNSRHQYGNTEISAKALLLVNIGVRQEFKPPSP